MRKLNPLPSRTKSAAEAVNIFSTFQSGHVLFNIQHQYQEPHSPGFDSSAKVYQRHDKITKRRYGISEILTASCTLAEFAKFSSFFPQKTYECLFKACGNFR